MCAIKNICVMNAEKKQNDGMAMTMNVYSYDDGRL